MHRRRVSAWLCVGVARVEWSGMEVWSGGLEWPVRHRRLDPQSMFAVPTYYTHEEDITTGILVSIPVVISSSWVRNSTTANSKQHNSKQQQRDLVFFRIPVVFLCLFLVAIFCCYILRHIPIYIHLDDSIHVHTSLPPPPSTLLPRSRPRCLLLLWLLWDAYLPACLLLPYRELLFKTVRVIVSLHSIITLSTIARNSDYRWW